MEVVQLEACSCARDRRKPKLYTEKVNDGSAQSCVQTRTQFSPAPQPTNTITVQGAGTDMCLYVILDFFSNIPQQSSQKSFISNCLLITGAQT
ncbi:hypothetical protein J6590_034520 [Homalodisca vitripennis]|nr:hypothetical protein J6590_034520 [Homalodisca vitripennis]